MFFIQNVGNNKGNILGIFFRYILVQSLKSGKCMYGAYKLGHLSYFQFNVHFSVSSKIGNLNY